jgi:hypothetical protein
LEKFPGNVVGSVVDRAQVAVMDRVSVVLILSAISRRELMLLLCPIKIAKPSKWDFFLERW